MKFLEFAQLLSKVEETSSRNSITEILADFLKALDVEDAKPAMYLLQGRLSPKYIPLEFNFSLKLIIKSLGLILDEAEVLALYKSVGDAGLLLEKLLNNWDSYTAKALQISFESESKLDFKYNPKNLDLIEVYNFLELIATDNGGGSQERKMHSFLRLILSCDPLSAKYIGRMIIGSLRIGLSDKTILDALSWAVSGDKSLRKLLDLAFGFRADIGEIAKILVANKFSNLEESLSNLTLLPGIPVASKLVERESNSQAVWNRMPNCLVQPKLDGLRGQIHFDRKQDLVQIFSRNMENMTEQYPEIISAVKNLKVDSIILDSEIIGFDLKTNSYSKFQDTMKRKRKYNIEELSESIPVKAMCFDCLYLNGVDLTKNPVEDRIEILKEIVENQTSAIDLLETKEMHSAVELDNYFKEKIGIGLEGIIIKQKGTDYEPGTRNFKWIKLKANSVSEMVDTIDVAVIGYYIGRGSRSKFGFGAFLAAVYNPLDDKYYTIGKVGSGFTEEQMQVMFKDLADLKIENIKDNYVVSKTLYPDVWVNPNIVAEIDADEITRSGNHTAAINLESGIEGDDTSKGLSVRFPRMKKWKRDKDLPNTVEEVLRMYKLRKS